MDNAQRIEALTQQVADLRTKLGDVIARLVALEKAAASSAAVVINTAMLNGVATTK